MTLYWDKTGPIILYVKGMLKIADLNPEVSTEWRMSRKEMLVLGWRCILAALHPTTEPAKAEGRDV